MTWASFLNGSKLLPVFRAYQRAICPSIAIPFYGFLDFTIAALPESPKNPLDSCRYLHIQWSYRSRSRAIMDNATNSIDTISRTCIAVRLRLLNRVVTNLYDEALRPLGLKVSQLNILIVTARLGLARPAQVCDILQ